MNKLFFVVIFIWICLYFCYDPKITTYHHFPFSSKVLKRVEQPTEKGHYSFFYFGDSVSIKTEKNILFKIRNRPLLSGWEIICCVENNIIYIYEKYNQVEIVDAVFFSQFAKLTNENYEQKNNDTNCLKFEYIE